MGTTDFDRARIDSLLRAGVDRLAVPGVVGVVVDQTGVRYEGAFAGSSPDSTVMASPCSGQRRRHQHCASC